MFCLPQTQTQTQPFHSNLKPKSTRVFITLLAAICYTSLLNFTIADWSDDFLTHYDWSHVGHKEIGRVEGTVSVDMESLSPGNKSSLKIVDTFLHTLRIELQTDNVEPCSLQSNRLLIQHNAKGNSTALICGNEIAEIHLFVFPAILTFIKGSGPAESQINKFQITIKFIVRYNLDDIRLIPVAEPRLIYSPNYPNPYLESTYFTYTVLTNNVYAIFFQVRYNNLALFKSNKDCVKRLVITGIENRELDKRILCHQPMVTTVVKGGKYRSRVSVMLLKSTNEVDKDAGVRFPDSYGYEVEYRTVKIGPTIFCNASNDETITVTEATYVKFSLFLYRSLLKEHGLLNNNTCRMTFPGQPSKSLMLTSLSWDRVWPHQREHFDVKVYIGAKVLDSAFSVIRAPPGQDVRIEFTVGPDHKDWHSSRLVEFVIETYNADAIQPIAALDYPAYIWKPRSSNAIIVRTPRKHCVKYSTLDADFKPHQTPLVDRMTLYSGFGEQNNFELTADCYGRKKNDSFIIHRHYSLTTAVCEPNSSFWFLVDHQKFELCEMTPTQTEMIESTGVSYPLFDRLEVKRNMACMFAIPPFTAKGRKTQTKFRGHLEKVDAAYLTVKDALTVGAENHIIADFKTISSLEDDWSGWFYIPKKVYIYFMTGSVVSSDMVKMEYGSRYAPEQPHPACPGPLVVDVTEPGYYTTPDFPNYLMKIACRWTFRRPRNQDGEDKYIHVFIDDLKELPCKSSTKLYIKDSTKTVDENDRVCSNSEGDHKGHEKFLHVYPENIDIHLSVRPDNQFARGIKFQVFIKALDYTKDCSENHTMGSYGIDIEKRIPKGQYLVPFKCQFKIHVRKTEVMTINLWQLYIVDTINDKCDKNMLTIYDGLSNSSHILASACYTQYKSIDSSGNVLFIEIVVQKKIESDLLIHLNFKSDYDYSCSDNMTTMLATEDDQFLKLDTSGKSGDRDCLWKLVSLDGYEIEVDVVVSYMYSDEYHYWPCDKIYLEVFNGPDSSAPFLGRVCGNFTSDSKPMFRSSERVLYIHFHVEAYRSNFEYYQLHYYTREHPSKSLTEGDNDGHTYDYDDDDDDKSGTGILLALSVLVFAFCVICCLTIIGCIKYARARRGQRENEMSTRESHPLNLHSTDGALSQSAAATEADVNSVGDQPPSYGETVTKGYEMM